MAVAVSLILPYFSKVSVTFLIQLVIALSGILWFCYDFFTLMESQTRSTLRKFLDSVVLDDVLRAIHDPETGLIACIVGTFVGTSSMYTLRMNAEQRTKLVQASLWTSNDQARTVLLSPGGCKSMLPEAMQTWLDEGDIKETNLKPDMEGEEEGDSDTSQSECGVVNEEDNSISSDEPHTSARGIPCSSDPSTAMNEQNDSGNIAQNATKEARCEDPSHGVTDPVTVMFSILRELACERMKPYIQSIPECALENVGISAALALALQLAVRIRSKRSFLSSLSALALSGIATGAFSTVLARHAVLGNIHNKKSLQIVVETVALRIWEKIKNTAMSKVRWKGVLAMFVLILVGRKGNPSTSRPFQR
jgi:hypothetical protein